jgi:hypothetical protein
MSKYEPLTDFLKAQKLDTCPLSFGEIERILGAELPPSSKTHRAWWSNNPSNNVMTKAWLAAGWETEQVDMNARKLVFVRKRRNAPPPGNSAPAQTTQPRRLFGALAGTITVNGDLTVPAGAQWNAVKGVL